ncbi:TPA: hypothetical protein ACIYO3_002664, partial [Escherichia coli]
FFTAAEWCIIGRDLQCLWQGPVMHHPDVVNIAQITLKSIKPRKYIFNRRTRRFFLFLIRKKKTRTLIMSVWQCHVSQR